MFTGLVQRVGLVVGMSRTGRGIELSVRVDPPFPELTLGESIAIDGICLTVTSFTNNGASFMVDVSPETISRSSLAHKSPGSKVNLERAMRLGDRLGGHLVLGHVDCVARVAAWTEAAPFRELTVELPGTYSRYFPEKGSISLDGVSLTVARIRQNLATVALIPATLGQTTLLDRKPGDEVNVEVDVLARYVESLLAGERAGPQKPVREISALLAENGFMR